MKEELSVEEWAQPEDPKKEDFGINFGPDPKEKKTELQRKRPPFTMLEDLIIDDPNISKHALLTYWILCKHADKDGHSCFPGLNTIARETRSGRTTVIEAIDELVKKEYITKTQRRNPNNPKVFTSNLYTINQQYDYKRKEKKKAGDNPENEPGGSPVQDHPSPVQDGGSPNQDGGVVLNRYGNKIPSSNKIQLTTTNNPGETENKEAVVVLDFQSSKNGPIVFTWAEVQKLSNETGIVKEEVVEMLNAALKKADTAGKVKNIKGWSISAVKNGWNLDMEEQPGEAEQEYQSSKERNEKEALKLNLALKTAIKEGKIKDANVFFDLKNKSSIGEIIQKEDTDRKAALHNQRIAIMKKKKKELAPAPA
jgi:hypothetical protein